MDVRRGGSLDQGWKIEPVLTNGELKVPRAAMVLDKYVIQMAHGDKSVCPKGGRPEYRGPGAGQSAEAEGVRDGPAWRQAGLLQDDREQDHALASVVR